MSRYIPPYVIETAWVSTSSHREPREYRLTPGDRIVCSDDPADGTLIGCYDGRVTLRDFRADVSFTARERRASGRAA